MGAVQRLPWWASLIAAAAGGALLDVASPGVAWWPAAFAGVALVLAAVWQQRWPIGLLAGIAAGAAFWMPHISWLTLYLGPVPWLGLSAVMIFWFALFGIAAAGTTSALGSRALGEIAEWGRSIRLASLAARPSQSRPHSAISPSTDRFADVSETARTRRWRGWKVAVAQALAVAGLWVLREQVQGSWPYGGFAWGRLAHTQADGPLAQAVSWTGFAGLSGLIVFACALPVAAAFAGLSARGVQAGADPAARETLSARPGRIMLAGGAAGVVILLVLALLPAASLQQTGSLRVAAVQGNSKSGIFDDRESGDVLRDHIAATEDLLDRLEADDETVDVIVWPENSAEFGLPASPLASQRVAKLAKRAGAPIVVGTILENPDGSYTNSSLVWGSSGSEPARYDKRYPVPFAEYMPNREFFHMLAPDLVDLVQLEYTAGTLPAAFEVPTAVGPVKAGIAICFDIIFDAQAVAMVDAGAEVIFAQTNNADFGRTDESAQQLAIARLRAIETGRALVNISTVGTSAVVAPDGRDLAALEPFTSGAMVAEVPLVTGRTPALLAGSAISTIWMVLGGLGIAAGVASAVRSRVQRGAVEADGDHGGEAQRHA